MGNPKGLQWGLALLWMCMLALLMSGSGCGTSGSAEQRQERRGLLGKLSKNPNDAESLRKMAFLSLTEGPRSEALGYAQRATEAAPESAEGWSYYVGALVAEAQKTKDKSQRHLILNELQTAGKSLLASCEKQTPNTYGYVYFLTYCEWAETAGITSGDKELAVRAHALAVATAEDALQSASPGDRAVGKSELQQLNAEWQGRSGAH
jgi:hypothetical protein